MVDNAPKSKIITVSLLLQEIKKDAHFFDIPNESQDTNVIRDALLKKYHTDTGILECFVDGERFIIQWYPDNVDDKAEELHRNALQLVKKNQTDRAIQYWEKAYSLNNQDVDYLYKLGLVHYELKKYKIAAKYLEKAVGICPIHHRAHLLLGINWLKLRNFEKAEHHVVESNRLNRSNIRTYLNLGAIYSIQKRFNEAIEMFNATIQLSPSESRAYLGLARIYSMLNDAEAANSYFKKVIELSPNTLMAEYAKRSIHEASVEEIDVATSGKKEDQISKGADFYLSGDYRVSSNKYKEYLNMHPSDDYAWYLLGETKLRTGELSEAVDCFKRAIRLNSNRGLYYKSLGIVYHFLNKSKETLEYIKKAIELDKRDAMCWSLQGIHSLNQKKLEAAINSFNLALKKNPNNPLVMYHLALAYIQNKQKNKSIELLKRILTFEYLVPIKNDVKSLLSSIDSTS
jgi:superkiller protein 3